MDTGIIDVRAIMLDMMDQKAKRTDIIDALQDASDECPVEHVPMYEAAIELLTSLPKNGLTREQYRSMIVDWCEVREAEQGSEDGFADYDSEVQAAMDGQDEPAPEQTEAEVITPDFSNPAVQAALASMAQPDDEAAEIARLQAELEATQAETERLKAETAAAVAKTSTGRVRAEKADKPTSWKQRAMASVKASGKSAEEVAASQSDDKKALTRWLLLDMTRKGCIRKLSPEDVRTEDRASGEELPPSEVENVKQLLAGRAPGEGSKKGPRLMHPSKDRKLRTIGDITSLDGTLRVTLRANYAKRVIGELIEIPLPAMQEVQALLKEYSADRAVMVEELAEDLPLLIEADRNRLLKGFDERDYPTAEEIRKDIVVYWLWQNLANAGADDLTPEIYAEQERQVRAMVERDVSEIRDGLRQMFAGLTLALQDRLQPDADGRPKQLRDTRVVDKLQDFLRLFELRNMGDESLAVQVQRVKDALAGVSGDDLKQNIGLRERTEQTLAAVNAAVKDMGVVVKKAANVKVRDRQRKAPAQ